jgi:hypothetical protein
LKAAQVAKRALEIFARELAPHGVGDHIAAMEKVRKPD